jgi:hypothetical protein
LRRRLPDSHHPAWRLAQQALTVGALVFVVYHLAHGHGAVSMLATASVERSS